MTISTVTSISRDSQRRPKRRFAASAGAPKALYWGAFLLCLPFLFGPNTVLACSAIAVGVLISQMVWRSGEPQLALFVCGYQWLQVFAPVVQSELAGVSVEKLLGGAQFVSATWLSLWSIGLFSISMGYALRKMSPHRAGHLQRHDQNLSRLNLPLLVLGWAGILLLDLVITRILKVPGITTFWNPIAFLRFGAAFMLFESVFARKRGWSLVLLVTAVETIVGMLGFFSGFKVVFFLLILASASVLRRQKSAWLPFAVALVSLVFLGLVWQAIKAEYRIFSSGGSLDQEVSVSVEERVHYLQAAAARLDAESFIEATDSALTRLGYVTFFGHCLTHVPDHVPHAGGRLWGEAVSSVFMPRVLFPQKKVFDDSDRTNEFSGIRVASMAEGASIGIGYVGESYIDFGIPGMFIPIVLFGLLVGGGYGWILREAKPKEVGVAIGVGLLFSSALLLESSNAKMVGAFVSAMIMYWGLLFLQKRLVPGWGPLLSGGISSKSRPRSRKLSRRHPLPSASSLPGKSISSDET